MYHIYAHKAETKENLNMNIYRDHNAEQIVRGLIHEGYEVSIKETREKNSSPSPVDPNEGAPQYAQYVR